MSFILDALRKVDQENRQSGEVVPPVAAVEKLRQERVRRRRSQFAAMAAIALASAVATALLLRRPPPRPDLPSAPAPQTAVEAAVESPVPEIEPPRTKAEAVVPERSPEPPEPGSERAVPPERDVPTPPVAKEPATERPRLVLQGTSVLDGRPVAVVSDRRVFEGDIIEGAVVITIGERSVELEFEGQRFTLTL
jgi:general secretion pathway protein B